ncbi:YlbF family regulator [Paenibacillus sp. IB182496]|uniref:UPF0342 protein IDH44_23970 n=1 Tax=Paenibacillus sabuli TaxID=2772509 RepID=A0A927GTV5_9BACL|nr:YlbF family regulator [Paenibacillus sabuli]MBD2848264.1 YlbF family regulator [Paenibacillus sabuli]
MNLYDKAYDLAKALRDSEEVTDLRTAREAVEADGEAKKMMDDFRERQNGLQQLMMSGEEPSEDDMETMNKLYEVLSLNPLINRLFEAERRFTVIFDDVNKIIGEALKNVYE